MFDDPQLPYQHIEGKVLGIDQRIQKSKLSEGIAVLFQLHGLSCAITASAANGMIETIFCKAPD